MIREKTISVTGGTGHLGLNVIKELLAQNYYVQALIRHSNYPLEHSQLNWISGDLDDFEALDELSRDCKAVIHCASAISMGEIDQRIVYDVNVNGTKYVADACIKNECRLIHISSSTAVTDPELTEIFDENRPYRTTKDFHYAWTKAIAEQLILENIRAENLDAVILRPTAIVGPEDRNPSRFGKTILEMSNGKLPFITSGGYNMVDVRDLSVTIINSVSKAEKGNIYLTGGAFISLKDLAKMINPSKSPSLIPIELLIKMLPLIQFYGKVFPLKWPVTLESLSTLKNAPKKMDCSKAIKELGHKNRPVQESVNDLLKWFHKFNKS